MIRLHRGLRKKHVRKKFCLSFYLTEDAQNIYNLSLPKADIYLAYRIAHCIAIYQETANHDFKQQNSRIKSILPNFQGKEPQININTIYGKSFHKKIREVLLSGSVGKLAENLIKRIRSPIVIKKKNRL